MSFDAKSGILKAINETNDPAMKTVLLLLLGVFEEIGSKIDNVLNNEQAIKSMVLNGHEPVHHKHHEWLETRIQRDKDIEVIIAWVGKKMLEEEQNAESKRKVRDGLLIEVLKYFVVGGLGLFVGSKLFGV